MTVHTFSEKCRKKQQPTENQKNTEYRNARLIEARLLHLVWPSGRFAPKYPRPVTSLF